MVCKICVAMDAKLRVYGSLYTGNFQSGHLAKTHVKAWIREGMGTDVGM